MHNSTVFRMKVILVSLSLYAIVRSDHVLKKRVLSVLAVGSVVQLGNSAWRWGYVRDMIERNYGNLVGCMIKGL